MTNIKLDKWADAERDCTAALKTDPVNAKALWRRGIARTRQGKLPEARSDLEAARQLEPGNASIEDELARLQWAEQQGAKDRAFPRDKLTPHRTKESANPTDPLNPNSSRKIQSIDPTPETPTSSSTSKPRTQSPNPSVAKPKRLVEELDSTPIPSRGTQRAATDQGMPKETITHLSPPQDSSLRIPPPPSQPYSPQSSSSGSAARAATQINTLGSLEKLFRQRPDNMAQILFNLDARRLPSLFGQFGFDTDYLIAYLEAISSRRDKEESWMSQSINLLDSLRKCGRFKIALTFAPAEKVRQSFEMVEASTMTEEEQRRLREVKQFWDME